MAYNFLDKKEEKYKQCRLCPRECGVDRTSGGKGFCGEGDALRLASASIHRGEEPPVTGEGGSGAIFVSGCNLGCVFCQNYQISRENQGKAVAIAEFAEICLALAAEKAENINIVTGTHAAPALAAGLKAAREQGLTIPALWNSSGYEAVETIELLADAVDVFLPDLKTLDPVLSSRFFNAPDYGGTASRAIQKMLELRGKPIFDKGKDGEKRKIRSGVIIRHLVLPDFLESTREVLRWFANHAQGRALLSLMTQYTPINSALDAPSRSINAPEYEIVLNWLDEFGIEDGFYQELSPDRDWLPDFERINPFSSELSTPVWHWKRGFI
jgi:putative pyruvate formate lyase activating enzyme